MRFMSGIVKTPVVAALPNVDAEPGRGKRKPKINNSTPPPPRNRDHNEEAKEIENYQCEISQSHKNFLRKDGNDYVEGHHIIPMKQHYRYELRGKNIDHVSNISVLCPNCHMKIHHGIMM